MRVLLVCAAIGLALHSSQAQGIHQRLLSFGSPNLSGEYPQALPIQGSDGALYGTTGDGGASSNGTVFRISTNGTALTVLHSFGATSGDGRHPYAGLVQGRDGALYGTTSSGGAADAGTVFKMQLDGSGYVILHSFSTSGGEGRNPEAALLQASDGAFYGTTRNGGTDGYGIVFRLNANGSGYEVLHSFSASNGDGRSPRARLMQGQDGALYGTTYNGGAYTNWGGTVYKDRGTVFKLNPNGSSYAVLYSFTGVNYDGVNPYSGLLQGSDGTLYGTTYWGGTSSRGTVYKLNPNGSGYGVLSSFGSGTGGMNPCGELVQDQEGVLYGTTFNGGAYNYGTLFTLRPVWMGLMTILHSFGAGAQDGQCPSAGLVQGLDGALYGTAYMGGSCGWGSVFKLGISPAGAAFTTLYSFGSGEPLGQNPCAELLQGQDGALYGTTVNGGSSGFGTLFKLNPDGTGSTLLYSFRALNSDGRYPQAALVQGQDGALYGTTGGGGTNGAGMAFKLSPNGAGYQQIYSFGSSSTDGRNPYGPLLQGQDGALYGTTANGGGTNGAGTVFRLSANGSGYSILHSFGSSSTDGRNPQQVGLIQGRDGALYGTTMMGGANNYGTVFKLNPDGSNYRLVHSFGSSGAEDGRNPATGLLQGSDGVLYGTTRFGGANNAGTVFKLDADGSDYRVLFNFPTLLGHGGWEPAGPLRQSRDGALYGATRYGGTQDLGTVFRLTVDGTVWSLLHSFSTNAGGGANPASGLISGLDGAWYGTTVSGGDWGKGSLFRLQIPQLSCDPLAPDGAFRLSLAAPPGLTSRLEASTNLVDWVRVTELTNRSGVIQFSDPDATHFPRRFYRSVWAPQ